MQIRLLASLIATGTLAPIALSGDVTQQFGYDFMPIRDAGNADFGFVDPNTGEYVEFHGAVDYEFRMSSTITTATQWADFLTDFVTAFGFEDVAGTSYDDLRSNLIVNGSNGFRPLAGREQFGVTTPWRGAAIYCNWLHHGQTSDPKLLLTGAYDASTFGEDSQGLPTDQVSALPGAKFWIPTRDEFVKAAYYDPNRHGEGHGGYWNYPDAGNEPLIPGFPEDGGETNSFIPPDFESAVLPVLSYPAVASAYGIHDVSGMLSELTGTRAPNAVDLYVSISQAGIDGAEINDRVLFIMNDGPFDGRFGFRVATNIPTPGGVTLVGTLSVLYFTRRRR